MKSLIVGKGEVGQSLFKVLSETYETYIRDVEPLDVSGIYVLNICFPYSSSFEDNVRKYQQEYQPQLTIIHSTVPVGTSRRLDAVHSPIHGKHPNLEGGIKTFVKYVGGEQAKEAHSYLTGAGIQCQIVENAETSELSKLYCTTQYGLNIILMKEIQAMCEKHGANFNEAYKQWNTHYNDGYREMGMSQFRRYILDFVAGAIGGHCVINNANILTKDDSDVAKFLLEQNEKYK